MGWSLPSPKRHRCATVEVSCVHLNGDRSDRYEDYGCWVRLGKERVPGPRSRRAWPCRCEEEAQACAGGNVFCRSAALSSRHRGLLERALLGAQAARVRAPGAADLSAVRKAVC